eukprot:3313397-Pyramimonas_sp.AAC.1
MALKRVAGAAHCQARRRGFALPGNPMGSLRNPIHALRSLAPPVKRTPRAVRGPTGSPQGP